MGEKTIEQIVAELIERLENSRLEEKVEARESLATLSLITDEVLGHLVLGDLQRIKPEEIGKPRLSPQMLKSKRNIENICSDLENVSVLELYEIRESIAVLTDRADFALGCIAELIKERRCWEEWEEEEEEGEI